MFEPQKVGILSNSYHLGTTGKEVEMYSHKPVTNTGNSELICIDGIYITGTFVFLHFYTPFYRAQQDVNVVQSAQLNILQL